MVTTTGVHRKMTSDNWLEISIPVKGEVILRFDNGTEQVVGNFEYRIPVKFESTDSVGYPTIKMHMDGT